MIRGKYLRLLRGGAEPAEEPMPPLALTQGDELVVDSERHLKHLYDAAYTHLRSVSDLPEAQVERIASYISLRMLLDGFRLVHA